MLVAKCFLTLVGLLYAYLAIWCSVSPEITSTKVGLTRIEDTGRSEFLTVYGGLEMGLAFVFLLPWIGSQFTTGSIIACASIHGCLVLFRSISLFLYPNVAPMTQQLAIGEWVIFILSLAVLWWTTRPADSAAV
jgi:hypothetical protein